MSHGLRLNVRAKLGLTELLEPPRLPPCFAPCRITLPKPLHCPIVHHYKAKQRGTKRPNTQPGRGTHLQGKQLLIRQAASCSLLPQEILIYLLKLTLSQPHPGPLSSKLPQPSGFQPRVKLEAAGGIPRTRRRMMEVDVVGAQQGTTSILPLFSSFSCPSSHSSPLPSPKSREPCVAGRVQILVWGFFFFDSWGNPGVSQVSSYFFTFKYCC